MSLSKVSLLRNLVQLSAGDCNVYELGLLFQELLWVSDWVVLCVAGLLHTDVGGTLNPWPHHLSVWYNLHDRQLPKVCTLGRVRTV